ncbi:MAG: formylglycine-generating enzyme family protein [Pseudomonadota bacterium]
MTRTSLSFTLLAAIGLSACGGESAAPEQTTSRMCLDRADDAPVDIPGGEFVMGENPRYPEEGPPRSVAISRFAMDAHEVTNAQFAAFVEATGYVTVAEREPASMPGASREMRQPGSAVFQVPTSDDPRWWRWVAGANWRQPEGPDSSIEGLGHLPVVQIAYEDALAYADWAGGTLPNEAQWEYAARAGESVVDPPLDTGGAPTANYYQGVFPHRDLGEDGYRTRAPVGCFAPNSLGLYDMIGNVWEWTAEPDRRAPHSAVIKGGSFLCATNYCARYRPAARQFQERGLGTNHIGFRLVYPASGD